MNHALSISTASRIRGSLYGVAVTDALGGPVEFCRRGTFMPVTSFRHNENFDLPPGTWTDDTSLTLCLAQSLIDTKGHFVAQDQVRKYVRWSEEGYMSPTGSCFDIGMATRVALQIWNDFFNEEKGIDSMDPQAHIEGQILVDKALKREVRAPPSIRLAPSDACPATKILLPKIHCGNGSLMRVAPIALIFHSDPGLALQNAALSSILTHPHPTNTEACQIYTHLLTLILSIPPQSKSELATAVSSYPLTVPKLRDRFAKYSDLASFAAVDEDQIKSSGYVVSTLESALWAFFTTEDFREGALKVVNLGHDADTVGAVYGGLAGAFYGIENVPTEWLDGLARRDMVEDVVEGVVRLVEVGEYKDKK